MLALSKAALAFSCSRNALLLPSQRGGCFARTHPVLLPLPFGEGVRMGQELLIRCEAAGLQIPVIISLLRTNKERFAGNKNFIINKKLIKAASLSCEAGEQRKGSLGAVQVQNNVSLAITLLFKECFDYIYCNKEYYSNIFVHNSIAPLPCVLPYPFGCGARKELLLPFPPKGRGGR